MTNIRSLNYEVHGQRELISELQGEILQIKSGMNLLVQRVDTLPALAGPTIDQLIRNGDLNHSWDSHERAAPVADDARFEAWQIYTNTVPVAAQQLLEDSVYSGALVANSFALPDAGRSDVPVVDPDWSRANGYARLGSTKSLDFPLPENRASPGRLLYISFIAAKRSANVNIPGRFYAGIWDNTAGKRDWLPASNFAITARTVGVPAATVSRDYLIVGRTDYGRTITSAAVTVANAPSDASFISGHVYVKLSWTPIAGVIQWDIYRLTAGVYVLLSQESVAREYHDQGSSIRVVSGYPVTTDNNQIAYVEMQAGAMASMAVDGVDAAWSQYDLAIPIPPTYSMTGTTDKQWLRIGFTQALTGTDAARGVLIDLIACSLQPGSFAHHSTDQGLQQPIAGPNGSTQGGAGTGGSGFVPPSGGGGEERCLTPEMEMLCVDELLERYWLPLGKLIGIERVLSPENGRMYVSEIDKVTEGYSETTIRLSVVGGYIRCSPSEPVIQTLLDRTGTRADKFKMGNPVLTYSRRQLKITPINCKPTVSKKRSKVIMITLKGPHRTFIVRAPGTRVAFVVHNVKPIEI